MEPFLTVAREWGLWVAFALYMLKEHGGPFRDWLFSMFSATYRRKLEAEAEAAQQAVSREDRLFSAIEKMIVAITQNTSVGERNLDVSRQILDLMKEQGMDLAELFGFLKQQRGKGGSRKTTQQPQGVGGD